jgi:hypothetical protein
MDNGRILFQRGLEGCGWQSIGKDCPPPEVDMTDVKAAVERFNPQMVVMWPRYEFDAREWKGPEVKPEHCFTNWDYLLTRPDIMRVVVWHDAGSAREQQKRWHEAYQPHVYLSWYHADSVMPFAPYVKREQIVRTYHNIDFDSIPPFACRDGVCIVSGAFTNDVYPLRTNCIKWAIAKQLGPSVEYVPHPGYKQNGTRSNAYCDMLSRFRVAVCTASSYKFALRKLFEATACGCRVITDLPEYDRIPHIDGNFIRVSPSIGPAELGVIIHNAAEGWNPDVQWDYADRAKKHYDYRAEGFRVNQALEDHYAKV